MGNWHGPTESLALKQCCEGGETMERGQVWKRCLRVDRLKEVEPQDLFQYLLDLPLDDDRVIYAEACIQKDLDRVFPHCFGQLRAEYCKKKYQVLLAYAQRCPDIGYESGMHFVAGVLVAVMDAEDAFWCLCSIIEKMLPASFYGSGDSDHGFSVELELFQELLSSNCPELATHLADLQVGMEMVLVSWFKSFFMCLEAPHDLKLRLLDSIFQKGLDGLHDVSLLLLQAEKSRFLQCQSFEEAVQLLAVLPIDYSSCDFMEPVLDKSLQLRRKELMITKGAEGWHFPLRRSPEIPWSSKDHWRLPLGRQRLVLLMLLALQVDPSSPLLQLPRVLWVNRILPFL